MAPRRPLSIERFEVTIAAAGIPRRSVLAADDDAYSSPWLTWRRPHLGDAPKADQSREEGES
jgi:hypothetical protein